MKRTSLICAMLLALVFPALVVGQGRTKSKGPAQVPADLQQAMSARDVAVAKADAATWDRLTTEDFTVVDATGTLLTKAMRLAQIKTDTATTLVPREEVTIKQYGNVFVRRFRAGAIWVVDIWVKEAKGWRVALVQVTPAKK